MGFSRRKRVRNFPFTGLDKTSRAYMLRAGILSDCAGFVPDKRGGYKNTPAWTLHGALPAGASIVGIGEVGPIATGGTAQITACLRLSTGYLSQYRQVAAGTWAPWQMYAYGGNQDNTRTQVIYFRKDGREFTLGWDLDTADANQKYGCALLESATTEGHLADPVCVEPYNASAVTATPATSGGYMGAGWIRIYLGYRGRDFPQVTRMGGVDHANYRDVHLTGTNNVNSVAIEGMLAGAWAQTDAVCIYRTRVVFDQNQLPFEKAYLEGLRADTVLTTTVGVVSDKTLITQKVCQLGKYTFPTDKQHGKYAGNLGLGVHNGRLYCHGVLYDYRVYFSGYTDDLGVPQLDDTSWAYSVDLPKSDKVVAVKTLQGKCLALGENGLYRLEDSEADPSFWSWVMVADLRGQHVDALKVVGDEVFIVATGVGGDWNVWSWDGYQFRRVGDGIRSVLDSSTGMISLDGMPVLTGGTSSLRHIMDPNGAWGKRNLPATVKWSLGKYSTFQSGAVLVATTAGVYYEGSAYSSDGSDYVTDRQLISDTEFEEFTVEWDKIYLFGCVENTPCTINVWGRTENGSWVSMGTQVVACVGGGGCYEIGVPSALRHGRMFSAKLTVGSAVPVTLEGITYQVRLIGEKV